MQRPTGSGAAAGWVRAGCAAVCLWIAAAAALAQGGVLEAPAPAETARWRADTVAALEQERALLARLHKDREALDQSVQRIARRAEVQPQGREFFMAVIQHLRRLPRAEQLVAESPRRGRQLQEVSNANLRVTDRLAALQDLDAAVAQRLVSAARPSEQRAEVEAALRRQLVDEQRELDRLDGLQRELVAAMQATAQADQDLLAKSLSAREVLNRLLFWVPARPGYEAVSGMASSLLWMVSAPHWAQVADVLRQQAGRAPYWPAAALLAALILALARPVSQRRLLALAPTHLGVKDFRMRHTLQALLISPALALPGPLLLMAVSGWLSHAADS